MIDGKAQSSVIILLTFYSLIQCFVYVDSHLNINAFYYLFKDFLSIYKIKLYICKKKIMQTMNQDKESEYIKTGDELKKFIDENNYTPTLSDYEVRLMKDHQHIINRINEIKKAIRTLDDFGVKVDDESMNIHFEHIM